MTIRPFTLALFATVLLSGCDMYGGQQVKPTHYKVVTTKVSHVTKHSAAQSGISHSHPANRYTKIVHHNHASGGYHHQHNYGKGPSKHSSKEVFHVKVIPYNKH